MEHEQNRPRLEIDNKYTIRLYPKNKTVRANYLGLVEQTHVFENNDSYVLVDDHWITEKNRLISYISASSFSISSGDKKDLPKMLQDKINDLRKLNKK